MLNNIKGKINYTYYYKFEDLGIADKENKFYEENIEDFVKDYKIAEDFLKNSPFEGEKKYAKDIRCNILNTKVNSLQIVATVYAELNLIEVLLNFNFEKANTDDIVFMHHILEKKEASVQSDLQEFNNKTIKDIADDTLKLLSNEKTLLHTEESTIIEINCCDEIKGIKEIYEDTNEGLTKRKEIYGMLVGDEGYSNVPEYLANERVENLWSSRNFVSFIAFSNKFLVFNLEESENRKLYLDVEDKFQNFYHGGMNQYFTFKPIIAGLNHGFLFSVENVMIVKALAKSYFAKLENRQTEKSNLKKDISDIKKDKEELELVLTNFEKIGIAELGVLEYKIIEKIQIIPLIDEIKYMLELIESKLEVKYSEATNIKVDTLTILGILISLVALIYTIIDHL